MSHPKISNAEARDLFSAYLIRRLEKAHPHGIRVDRAQEMANALNWAENENMIPKIETEEESFGLIQSAGAIIDWLVDQGIIVSNWEGWDATELRLSAEGLNRLENGDLPTRLHDYLEGRSANSNSTFKVLIERAKQVLAHPWWSGIGALIGIIGIALAFL